MSRCDQRLLARLHCRQCAYMLDVLARQSGIAPQHCRAAKNKSRAADVEIRVDISTRIPVADLEHESIIVLFINAMRVPEVITIFCGHIGSLANRLPSTLQRV